MAASPSVRRTTHGDGKIGRGSKKKAPPPPLRLVHLSTHEEYVLQPSADGTVGKKQLRRLRRLLRCHHTGREHAISGRLVELIYRAARHFNARTAWIIAGYRAPRVARAKGNPRSHHKQGLAADFRLEGVSIAALRDWLRANLRGVGVGFYPNANFVHLDVGRKQDAFWIDWSGPGQRAEYSADPMEDLRSGRADAPRSAPGRDADEAGEGETPAGSIGDASGGGGAIDRGSITNDHGEVAEPVAPDAASASKSLASDSPTSESPASESPASDVEASDAAGSESVGSALSDGGRHGAAAEP